MKLFKRVLIDTYLKGHFNNVKNRPGKFVDSLDLCMGSLPEDKHRLLKALAPKCSYTLFPEMWGPRIRYGARIYVLRGGCTKVRR